MSLRVIAHFVQLYRDAFHFECFPKENVQRSMSHRVVSSLSSSSFLFSFWIHFLQAKNNRTDNQAKNRGTDNQAKNTQTDIS